MRPKLFLTFALLCVLPLVLVSLLASYLSLRNFRAGLQTDLQHDLAAYQTDFYQRVSQHRRDLNALALNPTVADYVNSQDHTLPTGDSLKASLAPSMISRPAYSSLVGVDREQRLLFAMERSSTDPTAVIFETKPSAQVIGLETLPPADQCVLVSSPAKLRCSASIVASQIGRVGLLIADLRLDFLFAEVAGRVDASNEMIVLQQSGEILFHENKALQHQRVGTALQEFQPVANAMTAGQSGQQFYRAANGQEWLAVYAPLSPGGLSSEIGVNYSNAVAPFRRMTWLLLTLAILSGVGMALLLSAMYQRRARSLARVTKDVNAIAEGDLDMRIDPRSRDDMRDLAHSVNLVTGRLREQLAREAEVRQIESFVRVAAMLTHDLKNAINGLSMYVANLEEKFDSPAFRAESIEALTDATQKLQSLVDRLSNPVTTLSGEYKRPSATDLVPLVKGVVRRTTGPFESIHQIEVQLPESLIAIVDGERIETVVENLVINALDAMSKKPGTLKITGSRDDTGKVVLTVSDTGVGMNERFIEQKLFHAFATTKKKGMGLGLYTCREVVTANGGSIDVTSEVGVGTSFSVMLPSPPSDTVEA